MEIRAPPQNPEASVDAPGCICVAVENCLHMAVPRSLPRVVTGQNRSKPFKAGQSNEGMADIGWFCKSIDSMRKEHLRPRSKSEARSNDPPDLRTETKLKQTYKKWTKWMVGQLGCWTPLHVCSLQNRYVFFGFDERMQFGPCEPQASANIVGSCRVPRLQCGLLQDASRNPLHRFWWHTWVPMCRSDFQLPRTRNIPQCSVMHVHRTKHCFCLK